MNIKIAARKSDLARLQAYRVGEALRALDPSITTEFVFSLSAGDKDQETELRNFGDKGAFTQDFYHGLVNGEFDLVVHSWKDLPTEERKGTRVVATMDREDARDIALVKKSSVQKQPSIFRVLTSSPRREYNLKDFFSDFLPFQTSETKILPVRGNIPTRLKKLIEDPEADSLIVAKAALDRLLSAKESEFSQVQSELKQYLSLCDWMVLPLSVNPAAAAQGALAIEVAEEREDIQALLQKINREMDFAAVTKERQILSGYGGGCHQKIGVTVLNRHYGEVLFLRGKTDDGLELQEKTLTSKKLPAALSADYFPEIPGQAQWFDRSNLVLKAEDLEKIKKASAIMISRNNVITDAILPLVKGKLLWCSGIKTWKALAKKGLWVSGCNESMGESEKINVNALINDKPRWLKLTHTKAPVSSAFDAVATYELIAKEQGPNISGKDSFYWMSGSSFEQALIGDPELKSKSHFCGPGNTYEQIINLLDSEQNVYIELSYSDWKKKRKE